MDYEKLAKKYRKKLIIDPDSGSKIDVDYGKKEIKKLTPHREPFLLIDSIESINFEEQWITGKRKINSDDPVFKGHFPNYPIYPGVLHIEMIGQLAICYYALAKENSIEIKRDEPELDIRALKILHTLFQYEVLPDDELTLTAKIIESDEFKIKGIGQIIKQDKICSVGIAEFYVV